jgi:hypothetical protein
MSERMTRRWRGGARLTGRNGASVTAVAALAAAGVLATGFWPARAGQQAAPRPAGHDLTTDSARPPSLFANLVLFSGAGYGPLQVRRAATGALITSDPAGSGAVGLAAYGDGRDLVIAKPDGARCATRLYRLRLSPRGVAGPLSPVGGVLPGAVYSLAASANGQVIAYTLRGCAKGQPGDLRVLDVRTGRTRQWTGLDIAGISPGRVAISGALSLSASGALLAFPALDTTASGRVTAQVVRVLRTGAAAGPAAARSRVVVRGPAAGPNLAGVALSRDGGSFYLCSVRASRNRRVTTVTLRAVATGRTRRTVATLAAAGPTFAQQELGCPLALAISGSFLLVPYAVHDPRDPADAPEIRLARIGLAAGRVTRLAFALPATGGADQAVSVVTGW